MKTKNEVVELLPCPFCGNKETLCVREISKFNHDVWCVHCTCSVNDNSRELAIKKWNTRTPTQCKSDDGKSMTTGDKYEQEIKDLKNKIAVYEGKTQFYCRCGGVKDDCGNGLDNSDVEFISKLSVIFCRRVKAWCSRNNVEYFGDYLIDPIFRNILQDTILPKFGARKTPVMPSEENK